MPAPAPTTRLPALLTLAFTALPPLALGAAHAPTLIALAALTAALTGAALYAARRAASPAPLTLPFAFAALLALVAAAQLIPLPAGLLGLLAPHAAEERGALAAVLPALSSSGPISLAPAETALAALRYATLAIAALGLGAALRLPHVRSAPVARIAALSVAVGGLVQLAVGAFHALVDTGGAVLGVIPTTLPHLHRLAGTFINPNHAGAFAALAALAAAGLASAAQGRPRAAWAAASAALAAHTLLIASRSATLGLLGGAVVFALASLRGRERSEARPAARQRPLLGVIAALLGLAALVGLLTLAPEPIQRQLFWDYAKNQSLEDLADDPKLVVIAAGARHIGRAWPTGIGADGFGRIAPAFHRPIPAHRYAFVESDPIQLPLDLGIPAALVAFALAGWIGVLLARPDRNPNLTPPQRRLNAGLLAGLAALALSSLASFNLALLGLALPALALVSILLRARYAPTERALTAGRAAFVALPLLLIAATAGALHYGLKDDEEAIEALRAEASTTRPSPERVRGAAVRALDRIPADPLELGKAALLLQAAATRHGDDAAQEQALAWADLAAARAPSNPTPHVAAARALYARRDPQAAARRYEAALAASPDASLRLLREIFARLPSNALRAQALPARRDVLQRAVFLLYEDKKIAEALDLAVQLQDRYPDSTDAQHLAALMALRSKQPLLAELYARALLDAAPDDPRGIKLLLEALGAQSRDAEALALIADALPRAADPAPLRLQRATLCLTRTTPPEGCAGLVDADLDALRAPSARTPAERAAWFYLSGLRHQRAERPELARRDFLRAKQLQPDNPTYQRLALPGAP